MNLSINTETLIELSVKKTDKDYFLISQQLASQIQQKEEIAAELIAANRLLAFQNAEKEMRANELVITNQHLTGQIAEKEKLAADLIAANKLLAFQNIEKEMRTSELISTNQQLAHQIAEKERKAEELIIANAGLVALQTQLKNVNKELEAFSYSVSHDLRAPLRAISGYSLILKEDYSSLLGEGALEIIEILINSARHMGQLIDDLLKFSQLGRLEVIQGDVDMEQIVQWAIKEINAGINLEKYLITIHPLPACNGDSRMLKQAWMNLLDNAFKYSSKKQQPEIEIGCHEEESQWVYYVKDNGVGFEMEYADKLFQVFERLHRKEDFEGTGLGLSLVKRIIEKHNGMVYAESGLNTGSVFCFTIPRNLK